jgi:hypothetical protein
MSSESMINFFTGTRGATEKTVRVPTIIRPEAYLCKRDAFFRMLVKLGQIILPYKWLSTPLTSKKAKKQPFLTLHGNYKKNIIIRTFYIRLWKRLHGLF